MKNAKTAVGVLFLAVTTLLFAGISQASASTSWGSIYFDGTQYLSTTDASAPTSGNFTYEFWFYSTATSTSNQVMMNTRQSVTFAQDQDGIDILITPARRLFVSYKMVAFADTADNTISTNRWYHVAVVRSGNTIYTYLDGSQVAATAMENTWLYSQKMWIGSTADGAYKFTGNISNFRYTKSALYSSNFRTAFDEFQSGADTSILLKTRNDGTFADNSIAGTTFANNGSATASILNPFEGRVDTYSEESNDQEAKKKAEAERAARVKSAREKLYLALVTNQSFTAKDMSDAELPLNSTHSLLAAFKELNSVKYSLTTPLPPETVAEMKFLKIMKYAMVERIAGINNGDVYACNLVKFGLIEESTPMKQLATYRLMKLPVGQRDTLIKIEEYYKKSSEEFIARKERLAAIIAKIQSRG